MTYPCTWSSVARPWDDGITWRSNLVTKPDAEPLDVAYVYQEVLHGANGVVEDNHVSALIKAARELFEQDTGIVLMPQTWELILSGFPASGEILLDKLPVIAVDSVAYLDADGASQALIGSPAEYQFIPSGDGVRARILPLVDASFPDTQAVRDAVTIQYQAGYADRSDIPERYLQGMALVVGELYKQRSLSVQGLISTPSALRLERFWRSTYPLGGIW